MFDILFESDFKLIKSVSKATFSSVYASIQPPPPPPASETLTTTVAKPFNQSLQWVSRTAFCDDLSFNIAGKRVRLCGWVALHRVHGGGLTFLNLRDHTGILLVLSVG